MAISTYARALLKQLEGLRLTAYPDPGSGGEPWTIAYGHTGGIKRGDVCAQEQADAWLDEDIAGAEAVVAQWVTVPLTSAMHDALVLFVFNIGPGVAGHKDGFVWLKSGRHSTLLTKLNAGDYEGAAAEFTKWDRASGQVLESLHKRRTQEAALFLSGGLPQQTPQQPQETDPDATITPEPTPTPTPAPKAQPWGFPAGEADPVYETQPTEQGAINMATITDVVDSPISKFLLAAVNPILGIVPEIAHIFLDKAGTTVPERNVAAATKLVQVAQTALAKANMPAVNAQQVVQSIQDSAEAARVVREAVIASYFELTSIGGGPEAARKADLAVIQAGGADKWALLKSPSFVMGVFLLPIVYAIVLNLIGVWGKAEWSPDARAGLAGMITGSIIGGLVGYYYGQTTSRNRTLAPATQTDSAQATAAN